MTAARPRIDLDEFQVDFLASVGNKHENLANQRLKDLGAAIRKSDEAGLDGVRHFGAHTESCPSYYRVDLTASQSIPAMIHNFRMQIPKAIRLPLAFNGPALRRELERVERTAWVRHFNTGYYTGDWEAVSLRSTSGNESQIYPDPAKSDYSDTNLLRQSPIFQAALATFQCPLLSVRLMRLAAGSAIREHRDHCLSFEDGEVRVHIPVRTNPLVEFYLNGERVAMEEGEAWYLNLNEKHAVINRGSEDRVHLVVDCVVNGWLRRMAGVMQGGLDEFREMVFRDPDLMRQLQAEADRFEFVNLVEKFAAEHGFQVSADEVNQAIRAGRQAWHLRKI